MNLDQARNSWDLQHIDLEKQLFSIVFIDPNSGWSVGSEGTILQTTNGGASWTTQSSGTHRRLLSVSFVDTNIGWAVGDSGTVLKTMTGGTVTSVEHVNSYTPDRFVLEQNYPNPFNPATTISYLLRSRERVKISIFNLLGHQIATLVDEIQNAGSHSIVWNASTVPSGVYFYRIRAGNFIESKKLTLMK